MFSVVLLFWSQGFAIVRDDIPVLEVSVASALAVLFVANVLTTVMLSRQGERDDEAKQEPPCAAVISALEDDEAVIARMRETFKLSARETDTLRLAMKNMSAKQMASELFVAESTVNSHLKSLYRKVDVHSKKDLVKLVERYRKQK